MRTVTIDTNLADLADCPGMIDAALRRGLDVSVVRLTDREMSLSGYRPGVDARIPDTFVLGDASFGTMVLPSERESELFEQILRIISNGSFPRPGSRHNLTPGHQHHRRDALILLAHVRDRRDLFVSNGSGFVKDRRREKLEHLLSTRIMTSSEFLSFLAQLAE